MRKSINNLTAALWDLRTGPDASAGLGQQEIYYCWSHGITSDPNHISKKCRRRKEGHKEGTIFYS
eukprot:15008982-Ditylum_brightwellii.AAC.1